MYKRILDIKLSIQKRSYFIFGPRATGKSTYLRINFPEGKFYDLLSAQTFHRLLKQPHLIEEETTENDLVIIDEIQKYPELLDEVHRLISIRNQRFILTGSSARKLKRGCANLLAGRARWVSFFPLTSQEIPDFKLETYLSTGGLPQIYGDSEASLDLKAYVDLYLREEVLAEGLVRNIHGFSDLLDVLGLLNGKEINLASIASDTGLQAKTVGNYIDILEETLLAFRLPVFQKTTKRKATSRVKLYFFDLGVVNALCNRSGFLESPEGFGDALEHFIILEIRAYLAYSLKNDALSFWRTASGFEVDVVIGDYIAIEIKSSTLVLAKHLKGLRALKDEGLCKKFIVVSCDSTFRRTEDGIEIYPWSQFLKELWGNNII